MVLLFKQLIRKQNLEACDARKPHSVTIAGSIKKNLLFLLLLFLKFNSFGQTVNPKQYQYVFTVAKDGTGDFKYIQDAIDAMRVYPLAPISLFIKNGVYNEKIELPANNTDVNFIGENVDSVIIVFNDYSGRGRLTTFTSFTAKISGNRFYAQNITFSNNAGRVGQAVALYVDADKAVFKNCKFLGDQDTIFCAGETSRQLFADCYIEGTTDFIFGPSTSVFQNCVLKAKADSYITAANTTPAKKFGFVFLNCKIETSAEVQKVYLGRPWRAHAKTVFLRCELPVQVRSEGWHNWGNPENEKSVLYAEYQSIGPGANPAGRAGWSRQLNEREAASYTLEKIFTSCNAELVGEKDWFLKTTLKPFEWTSKK